MKAELLLRERRMVLESVFTEIVIWKLPAPSPGSDHGYKYRLALVDHGICILRYDNEAGKGDHRHFEKREVAYEFRGLSALLNDFGVDVERWRLMR